MTERRKRLLTSWSKKFPGTSVSLDQHETETPWLVVNHVRIPYRGKTLLLQLEPSERGSVESNDQLDDALEWVIENFQDG